MAGAGDERDDQELGTRGMARARAVDERMAGAAGGVDRVAGIPRRNTGVGQAGAGGTVGREGGWRCSGGGGGWPAMLRRRRRWAGGSGGVEKRRKNEVKKVDFCLCKQTLPSAHDLALGKDFFKFKNTHCRVPTDKHSTKNSLIFLKKLCRAPGFDNRQRSLFAECPMSDTRQSMLCRVSFLDTDTRQSIFLFFFISPTKLFVVCCYTM
jgi:hypothetical protein